MEGAMISTAQMRMMYGLAKKCSMDNDSLHGLVYRHSKVESIKDLTMYQAKGIIDYLMYLSGQEKMEIPDRATEAQRAFIHGLARDMGWEDNPKRMRGFLESRFGIADIAFLTQEKASDVIEALKAMAKREQNRPKSSDAEGVKAPKGGKSS
jgi:hypothetical protein